MSAITRADYRIWLAPYLAGQIEENQGAGAVKDAFDTAAGLLRGDYAGGEDGGWRESVLTGSVEQGAHGPELLLTVRLNIKKGPKIWEIGACLLEKLDLDPRLLRVERRALWVGGGDGAMSPFDVLDERPWETAAGMEG